MIISNVHVKMGISMMLQKLIVKNVTMFVLLVILSVGVNLVLMLLLNYHFVILLIVLMVIM